MTDITLRVIEGADRGRVFEGLKAPISIGREEGNTIQLNDERISRFHLKIQRDHNDLVLTDLESTNGCKVNNEDVNLRILRLGDLISLGRSTLIFGSRNQINRRLGPMGPGEKSDSKSNGKSRRQSRKTGAPKLPAESSAEQSGVNRHWKDDPNYQLALLDLEPPKVPERLSPGQAAQLSEMIEYLHMQVRRVIANTELDSRERHVELPKEQWQIVLDIQARLAEYLRTIGHPS